MKRMQHELQSQLQIYPDLSYHARTHSNIQLIYCY